MGLNQHQEMVRQKLESVHRLDRKVKAKMQQIEELRNLAVSINVNLSDMPGSPNRNVHKMEDTVVKICDIQEEAAEDVGKFLDAWREVKTYIEQVPDTNAQYILECRYLSFDSWEEIANELGYSVRNVQRIVHDAIDQIRIM